MPEIVFVHCQTYARKPNRAGQSIAQVVGEGLRIGSYCQHVPDPKPPVVLFGKPDSFEQLHDDHVAQRRTRVLKDGSVSERAIRADRHTLLTIIASYPVPTNSVATGTEGIERLNRWVNLTIAWVQSQYGNQMKVVLGHTDETYPHLHFWILSDDPGADAALLHPGKSAKRAIEARLKSAGTPPQEAVAAGNRALKTVMRAWIDDYHRKVGAPLGMRRDGHKRRRLSRGQYMAEQAMVGHHRQLEEDRIRLEVQVATLENTVATMAAQRRKIEAQAAAFVERAKQHHLRMRDEGAQVAAFGPMLDALVTEIEDQTITFEADSGWKVRDPAPFRAAGKIWTRLEPAIRRLVGLIKAAEDGSWIAGSEEPGDYPRIPDPTPF